MIGEESPLGVETFHFKFLSGPNSTGGFAWSATPEPFGPRNRGQTSELSALKAAVVNTPPASNVSNGFMRFMMGCLFSFVHAATNECPPAGQLFFALLVGRARVPQYTSKDALN